MEWGFVATDDILRMDFTSEPWFASDTAFEGSCAVGDGDVHVCGSAVWELCGRVLHHRTAGFKQRLAQTPSALSVRERVAYYSCGRDVFCVTEQGETKFLTWDTAPRNLWSTEAGLLVETVGGLYAPDRRLLCDSIRLFATDEGVVAAVSPGFLRIWFTASWTTHHRIAFRGAASALSVAYPWAALATNRGEVTVYNVRTGSPEYAVSVAAPRAVAVNHAGQLTCVHADGITFFDDSSSVIYAAKGAFATPRGTKNHVWVRADSRLRRTRAIDGHMLWPVQLCMWCEAPLAERFPAPPEFVAKTVPQILADLRCYWLPRSILSLGAERETPHAREFAQLMDMDAWTEAFHVYAAETRWTREEAHRARARLRVMEAAVDLRRWAAVGAREPDEAAFDQWDVLCEPWGPHAHGMVFAACEARHSRWLTSRGCRAAESCVHEFLIPFVPVSRVKEIFCTRLTDWTPPFVAYVRRTRDWARWLPFTELLVHHGFIGHYPAALELCYEAPTFVPAVLRMEYELVLVPEVLATAPEVLLRMFEPSLHVVRAWPLDRAFDGVAVLRHRDRFLLDAEEICLHAEDRLRPWGASAVSASCDGQKLALRHRTRVDVLDSTVQGGWVSIATTAQAVAVEDDYRVWTVSVVGVVRCWHAVTGDKLHELPGRHRLVNKLRAQEGRVTIVTDEYAVVYDVPHKAYEREAPHMHDAVVFDGRLLCAFEDNTLCFDPRTPFITTDLRVIHMSVHGARLLVATALEVAIYDAEGTKRCAWKSARPLRSLQRVGSTVYALEEDRLTLLRFDEARLRRLYAAASHLPASELQRHAVRLVPRLMYDVTLADPAALMAIVRGIMDDRACWVHLIREDVLEWLLTVFFDAPKQGWDALWKLFKHRGGTFRCSICMSSTVGKDRPLALLGRCAHRFHRECIQRHVEMHGARNADLREEYALTADLACPVCRTAFEPDHIVDDPAFTELVEYDSE